MQRLLALLVTFCAVFAPELMASSATSLLEMTPVKIHVDKMDRIRVTFQKECGATFAGFVLRTSAEKELFVAALSHRPHVRCLELTPLEEFVLPKLRASDFALVSSINPSTEPVYLKLSPVQNFNQVKTRGEDISFELAYTSQCGTALGLNVYPTAAGLELGVLEGRSGKYEHCNRSTKKISYPHIDLSSAALKPLALFQDDVSTPARYTLRRAQTRFEVQNNTRRLYFFRRCSEAPVGLIRNAAGDGTEISVLLAHYPDLKCAEGSKERMWTPWPEEILDKDPVAFKAPAKREQLVLKRPLSYNFESDSLSIASYASCQKDIGIVSRTNEKGYAVAILQIQTSAPCNSSMKEVNFTFDWNFAHGVKRDIKPLQLVGY